MSEPKYSFVFEKHGAIAPVLENRLKNEIWIDVGNRLDMRAYDHHQGGGLVSSFGALIDNIKSLRAFYENIEDGPVSIHMHEEPDFDCIMTSYALKYYLEKGEEKFSELFVNGYGKDIRKYVDDIEQGRNKNLEAITLYAMCSYLYVGRRRGFETDKYVVEKGWEILDAFYGRVISGDVKTGMLAGLDLVENNVINGKAFEKEIVAIKGLREKYDNEIETEAVRLEEVLVWELETDADGNVKPDGEYKGVRPVNAAIWNRIPEDSNEYCCARNVDNCVVTVVPYLIKGEGVPEETGEENISEVTRVFVSINPEADGAASLSLRPIAEVIEQMEQIEEQRYFEQNGAFRRDHSRPRTIEGHLDVMPFAATSDPWYVSEEQDLFDAPRMNSLLEYDDIAAVIRGNGSMVKGYRVYRNGEFIEGDQKELPLCGWQEKMRKVLGDQTGSHTILWAELDSSILRKSNRILEGYCMNLTGRSFHETKDRNTFFPDYRTCIYSDLHRTIILSATCSEKNGEGKVISTGQILSKLLDTQTPERFKNSELVKDITSIVAQRSELLEIGRKVGELRPGERHEIEVQYKKLLKLSARMQKEDVKTDPLQREIYRFIKNEFGINDLKASIMEEMGILVGESRDRFVSRFNILAAVSIPFVLVSTLFQMGAFGFRSGEKITIGWFGSIIIIAIIMLAILFWGKWRKDE